MYISTFICYTLLGEKKEDSLLAGASRFFREKIWIKPLSNIAIFLQHIQTLPLSWLLLSRNKRVLIVVLSYWLGIIGLWILFPLTHNGATMFLPIMAACWLFRYRGLLVSLILSGIAFQITYKLLLHGMLPDQAFLEGGVIGFGTSLGLGIIICWLRTAVDLVHDARQRTLVAEQERLLALQAEQRVKLAYEQQRHINELKNQFLDHVSHELRTPLTVLGSFLEIFKDFFDKLEPAERTQLLTHALTSYEELVNLVDGTMDAIATTGAFPLPRCEDVDIGQIVQKVLTNLHPQGIQAYTIDVQIAEYMLVWADPDYLSRILHNLLSNVIKYVPKQTTILIEAVQPAHNTPIYISVQDAGPGIPPEELAFLFEKLTRLKRDVAGTIRGTGLGLYICKYLIEAMNGHIWAESSGRPGEGSRFIIDLPPSQ
jgi:signal transduction histidine kinase